MRIQFNDGTTRTQRLTPTETTFQIAKLPSALAVVETYFELGIEHILLGIDHLLFVFALLLLVSGARRLVATITAFTAAHSITLAAATLDWVRLPAPPLEAVIALSIAFVAAEILQAQKGNTSLTIRQPWLVAFTFGLLHGFGFAGALAEIGLPSVEIPLALLFFNVGVEAGQLLFIAAVSCVFYIGRRLFTSRIAGLLPDLEPSQGPSKGPSKGPSQRPVEEQSEGPAQHLANEERTSSVALSGATVAAYAIGGIAMFWVCERTAAFLL